MVDDIGATGWKFDVEKLAKENIAPMVELARDAISDSSMEVDGLQMSKGAVGATVSGDYGVSNIQNRIKKQVLSKMAAALPFLNKPELKPVVSKVGLGGATVPAARIQGFGAHA